MTNMFIKINEKHKKTKTLNHVVYYLDSLNICVGRTYHILVMKCGPTFLVLGLISRVPILGFVTPRAQRVQSFEYPILPRKPNWTRQATGSSTQKSIGQIILICGNENNIWLKFFLIFYTTYLNLILSLLLSLNNFILSDLVIWVSKKMSFIM